MANSTPRRSRAKDARFPLWLHSGTGQWAKKIRGRTYYFGTDQDAALKEYLRVKDDLQAGRIPRAPKPDDVTLKRLCNAFLTDAQSKCDAGEITPRTFKDYYKTCELILDRLGKSTAVDQLRIDDLMTLRRWLAKRRGSVGLANDITRIRVVLNYAFNSGLIDRPVRYGDFKRPSKSVIRRKKAATGPKMFEPSEVKTLLENAAQPLYSMILLGINAGLGNSDCAKMEFRHLDLEQRWLDFPRPKTGIDRRAPLWPETVNALHEWLELRKAPKDDQYADLVFLTKYGLPWVTDTHNAVSGEFTKLLNATGLKRPGFGFYVLRHTFQTIGDEVGDYLATKLIMGHVDGSISATYRQRFAYDRLVRVTDHVRGWLFGEGQKDA